MPTIKYISLYLLMLLMLGMGYIAILPPFEGFDETAHYSSIRQIADTATIPLYGKSYMPQDVTQYTGPVAYGSLTPPFDNGMVYSKFFGYPELIAKFLQNYRLPRSHPAYVPSEVENWEAQHPPLYYLLSAGLMKATNGLSFVAEILLLRLFSFFMALGGVACGLLAFLRPAKNAENSAVLTGFILYPIILPMFFPEFARMGNDALCLLLAGISALFFMRGLQNEAEIKWPLGLGIVLGFGLLTKAFFLPMIFAIIVFLLMRLWVDRLNSALYSKRWRNILCIAFIAILIGGGWYVYKYMVYGDLIGSNDAIKLAEKGGLIANLKENFTVFAFIRGVVVTLVTWSWAGTWSVARIHPLLQMPLLLLFVWVIWEFLAQLKHRRLNDPLWLPVYMLIVFWCGMLWHIVISIAINGNGNTPGWYLHILMPWVAPALGVGLHGIFKNNKKLIVLKGLLGFAVLFQIIVVWAQFALFTGCASKGNDKYYAFAGHAFCLDQSPVLIERLGVIGWPALAGFCFGCGLLLCLRLVVVSLRRDEFVVS